MVHRRLLQLAGAVRGPLVTLAAFGVLLSALHIGFAYALSATIVALVAGAGAGGFWPSLATLAVLMVLTGTVIWMREVLAARMGASVRIRLRARLLERLRAVPAAERDSGSAATTVLDGVEGLDPYYTRYLPQLLVTLIVPAGVVVLVWEQSSVAGAVLSIAVAVAVLAPRIWDARLLRNGRLRWERFARLSSGYVEALQHIPLLRAFGASRRVGAGFAAEAGALRNLTMSQLRLSLIDTAVGALAMHLGVVLAVLAAIAATASGDTPAAAVVLILMLAREAFRPVQDLGASWHAGYLGLTAVDGLERLLAASSSMTVGAHDSSAASGEVNISGVSYRYPGTSSGITDLSLHVASGETVAVIGPSGSGKSTLARLLERDADPDRGAVSVGGIPLATLTDEARTRSVVVVPQDPVLFAWTVRENLRLYHRRADDEELVTATRAASIHDDICALPHGYDTVLTENGGQFSGGQRQRLAIARALLSPAPVLVFDEVTSALDLDTERRVMDAVSRATASRTVVLIAHRDTACTHATRWVALRDGRLAAAGDDAPSARDFLDVRGRV